ncbi:MAG: transposase [Elusimicrobiota bacterium]
MYKTNMTRPLRIEYNGAYYHIIVRGHRKESIFYTDIDRITFLKNLQETKDKYSLEIYAFVLMDNHYHLLLETKKGELSKAMHNLNTSYANWFKKKNNLVGSIFQGRYKGILIEDEKYMLAVSAYIHLNPIRAGIINYGNMYKWSSYMNYCNKGNKNERLVNTDLILSCFKNKKSYKEFINDLYKKGIGKDDIYGKNAIVGNEEFRDNLKERIKVDKRKKDITEYSNYKDIVGMNKKNIISIMERLYGVKSCDIRIKKRGNIYRKIYVYGLRKYTSLSIKEIGEDLNEKYKTISKYYTNFLKLIEKEKKVRKQVRLFDKKITGE